MSMNEAIRGQSVSRSGAGSRTKPTPADKIRQQFAAELDSLRSRKDLSTEGLQRQIAKAFVAAKTKMKALVDQDKQQREDKADELTRRLFGSRSTDSAAILSARDAMDRAARLTKPTEAAALAELAHQSDDGTLLRAIAQRAHGQLNNPTVMGASRQQWRGLLDEWAERNGHAERLAELDALNHRDIRDRFFAFSVSKPGELDGVGSPEVLSQAADDLEPEPGRADTFFGPGSRGVPEAG